MVVTGLEEDLLLADLCTQLCEKTVCLIIVALCFGDWYLCRVLHGTAQGGFVNLVPISYSMIRGYVTTVLRGSF